MRELRHSVGRSHRLTLKAGSMLKIHGGHALDIHAIEGRLWIIQEADVPDVELAAGQTLKTGNVTLIQALMASTLALVPVGREQYDLHSIASLVGIS